MGPKRYEEILQECRRTGQLYEDPDFPPSDTLLGEDLQWKRPHEICPTPQFTVDGAQRNHFVQGSLENCWFASAVGSLTSAKPLLRSLCSIEDHSKDHFDKTNGQYCGAFCFRFWQYDTWTEVIVDDRLPITMDGERPAFLHSADGGEFLGPLLEKAYAKLHGSYEALRTGHAAEALADLTAGWVEFLSVSDADDPTEIIHRVRDALRQHSQIVASITEESSSEPREMDNGLTINHGYVVIDYRKVLDNDGQEVCLLHLRDPKARESWNGAWCHDATEWGSLPNETKDELLQGTAAEPGEFWISSEDFLQNITTVEICNATEVVVGNRVTAAIARGEWKAGSSDDTFFEDPQFEVVIQGDQPEVTFTLELTQMERRRLGRQNLPIKFRLFALNDGQTLPLGEEQLAEMTSISAKKMYADSRSFVERFTTKPGSFAAIASTERTEEAVQFTLRLFCENSEGSITPTPP